MTKKVEKFVVISDQLREKAGVADACPVEQLVGMILTAEAMTYGSTIMFDSVEKAKDFPPAFALEGDRDPKWRTIKITFEEIADPAG